MIINPAAPSAPPPRSDIRPEDLSTLADLERNARRLGLQYACNPIVRHALTGLRDFLLERFPVSCDPAPIEPKPAPPKPHQTTQQQSTRRCTICADARFKEIDTVLQGGTSLRRVARQFQLSKSAVARHSRHRMQPNHA